MFSKIFGIGELSPEKFTGLVARMGVKRGRFINPAVDPAEMRITSDGYTMMLGNAYKTFLALPRRERAKFINESVLRPPPEIPETWEQAAPKLIANVRGMTQIANAAAQVRSMGAKDHDLIAHREIAPGLYATIAIDLPTQSLPVTFRMLKDWGKSFEEVLERGIAKLAASSDLAFIGTDAGFWIGGAISGQDDTYVAARILLPRMFHMCKDPYIVVPQRGKIAVGDPAVPGSYNILAALAHNPDDSYRVSSRIYQFVGGQLREATAPAGAGLENAELVADDIHGAYDMERHLYDKYPDESYFCAKYQRLGRKDTNEVTRLATWSQALEVPTHLPDVDLVSCVLGEPGEEDTEVIMVPFKALLAKCSFTRTNSPLTRWIAHPNQYPSAEWLRAHEYQAPQVN
ncbi:MAG TPA: hypothetical protein VGM90_26850 [Kofleriaceae bacterium]|jgi:hypothetical protein